MLLKAECGLELRIFWNKTLMNPLCYLCQNRGCGLIVSAAFKKVNNCVLPKTNLGVQIWIQTKVFVLKREKRLSDFCDALFFYRFSGCLHFRCGYLPQHLIVLIKLLSISSASIYAHLTPGRQSAVILIARETTTKQGNRGSRVLVLVTWSRDGDPDPLDEEQNFWENHRYSKDEL